jgi:hypothetical protein
MTVELIDYINLKTQTQEARENIHYNLLTRELNFSVQYCIILRAVSYEC